MKKSKFIRIVMDMQFELEHEVDGCPMVGTGERAYDLSDVIDAAIAKAYKTQTVRKKLNRLGVVAIGAATISEQVDLRKRIR